MRRCLPFVCQLWLSALLRASQQDSSVAMVDIHTCCHADVHTAAAAPSPLAALQNPSSVLVSAAANQVYSDYDPYWPILMHPEAFPYGVGACPVGMSFQAWVELLLTRAPASQFASNLAFQANLFSIWQRHEVNSHSKTTVRLNEALMFQIDQATNRDVELVLQLQDTANRGAVAQQLLQAATPAAKALLSGIRKVASYVPGSPAACAALRSKASALWNAAGLFTSFITLNPCPLNSHIFFDMVGHQYAFDARGKPDHSRPDKLLRWELVARNPVKAAQHFMLFMLAFQKHYMGWTPGAAAQEDPNCILGQIQAFFWKYENTGKGDLHAHGCLIQPALQPDQFLRLANAVPKQVCHYGLSQCRSCWLLSFLIITAVSLFVLAATGIVSLYTYIIPRRNV